MEVASALEETHALVLAFVARDEDQETSHKKFETLKQIAGLMQTLTRE